MKTPQDGKDAIPHEADNPRCSIAKIDLDERSIVRRNAEIEHERAVAIYDLIEHNYFAPCDGAAGPFVLRLSIEADRLITEYCCFETGHPLGRIAMGLSPFRRIVKDYFTICESYYAAIKHASPSKIETIDMARRALHDEGAELLRARWARKIEVDKVTARRLFTLLCVLHIRA